MTIPQCKHHDVSLGQLRKRPVGHRIVRSVVWLLCALSLPALLGSEQAQGPTTEKGYLIPAANRLPDANDQMRLRDQQAKKNNFELANTERKKQLAEDAAQLLALAKELKSDVDKTDKDTLSLSVMRKAEMIEKLAHGVREKMRLTVGGN